MELVAMDVVDVVVVVVGGGGSPTGGCAASSKSGFGSAPPSVAFVQ